MDFKGFYDEIIFDVDRSILKSYTGKQGDTKSRGLYVTVTQKNAVIDDLTDLSMRLFYEKPDKTRGFIDGVVDGSKFRIDYTNQMYAVPGVVKAELRLMGADGEIITAKTFKILVDSSIADGSIVSENERGILDRAFELAEDIIPRLELLDVELLEDVQAEILGARHSGTKDATYDSLGQRLDAAEQDLLDHKAEYTSNRQQDQLKIAKVEKDLNNYQSTLAQVNINQEATQTATGYGMVSLPKNAANGQVGVSIFGNTETDEEGNTKSTISAMRLKSVGKNLLPPVSKWGIKATDDFYVVGDVLYAKAPSYTLPAENFVYVPVEPNTTYTFSSKKSKSNAPRCDIREYDSYKQLTNRFYVLADKTTFTTTDSTNYFVLNIAPSSNQSQFESITDIQLEKGSVATPYEPYTESTAYIPNVWELRSLPNGTKDEIRISEGKLIKRVSDEVVIDGSLNWSAFLVIGENQDSYRMSLLSNSAKTIFPNAYLGAHAEGYIVGRNDVHSFISGNFTTANGKPYKMSINETGDFFITIDKAYLDTNYGGTLTGFKNYLNAHPITLNYQLAEPVEMPIQVSGSLISHPNGTVYVEPVVADAGIYADGMAVLHQDLPIKALEKLSKVDFMTGVETELDIEDIVIAENKLSFTHPDLSDGDIVFFEYEYDREGTTPETEIEYYDSRYTIKDSVTNKFYKWNVTVADGVPSIEVVEV